MSQTKLRETDTLTRVGSLFGDKQFCYAEKPGGVGPGFRAIDLDTPFFLELNTILSGEIPFEDSLFTVLKSIEDISNLDAKIQAFTNCIKSHIPNLLQKGTVQPNISWLCEKIRISVENNKNLSAWLYKFDYAHWKKNRLQSNKEALREYVGTYLAYVFSKDNQVQHLVSIKEPDGVHFLLACKWKPGLVLLKDFLHNGSGPDFKGILVENNQLPVKRSKYIPGLAKNLILGLAIGDGDGIGKEAQNKGIAENKFYGFDYGKTYDNTGVCLTIQDDFSFTDIYAHYPSILRTNYIFGVARHYMYRNYSIFYDTNLSERMFGLQLIKKMITGKSPKKSIIKSYPGLGTELLHIEQRTPSPQQINDQFAECISISEQRGSIGELYGAIKKAEEAFNQTDAPHFNIYFTQIKLNVLFCAAENTMLSSDLNLYLSFIDEMCKVSVTHNDALLRVFEKRSLLKQNEINLIDMLEKIYSPTTITSVDKTVLLNTLQCQPHSERISFQLEKNADGMYTISATNNLCLQQLQDDFQVDGVKNECCITGISSNQLNKLITLAAVKYDEKYALLLQNHNSQIHIHTVTSEVLQVIEPSGQVPMSMLNEEASKLIKRYEILCQQPVLKQIVDAIYDISELPVIQKLLQCNNSTLALHDNLKAVIEGRIQDIKLVEEIQRVDDTLVAAPGLLGTISSYCQSFF